MRYLFVLECDRRRRMARMTGRGVVVVGGRGRKNDRIYMPSDTQKG